jgi:hypothetical protein
MFFQLHARLVNGLNLLLLHARIALPILSVFMEENIDAHLHTILLVLQIIVNHAPLGVFAQRLLFLPQLSKIVMMDTMLLQLIIPANYAHLVINAHQILAPQSNALSLNINLIMVKLSA